MEGQFERLSGFTKIVSSGVLIEEEGKCNEWTSEKAQGRNTEFQLPTSLPKKEACLNIRVKHRAMYWLADKRVYKMCFSAKVLYQKDRSCHKWSLGG